MQTLIFCNNVDISVRSTVTDISWDLKKFLDRILQLCSGVIKGTGGNIDETNMQLF